MKNKIIMLLIVLFTLLGIGCVPEVKTMYIEAKDKLIIQQSQELKVYYEDVLVPLENLQWTLSDYNIASIDNGILYAKDYGKVVVGAVDKRDNTHYCLKEIEIVPPYVEDIIVTGVSQLYIDKTTKLEATVVPSIIESEVIWESSNENILIVDDGDVLAVGVGVADIIIKCDDFVKRYQIEVLPTPTSIIISGQTKVNVNEISFLTFNIDEEVTLTSSNPDIVSVIDNAIIGVSKGSCVITAVKNSDPSIKGTIEITVTTSAKNNIEMTDEEAKIIYNLMSNMSVEQMIGEMFGIGFYVVQNGWGEPIGVDPTTGLPNAQFGRNDPAIPMLEYLKNYKFGNFTIHTESGKDKETLQLATKTLKTLALNNTGVEPFISINSTGGYIMGGITSLPTNIAIANADIQTIYNVNELYATELRALGINSIINKYVSYNTTYNSSLNVYGNDIVKAKTVATIASKGLQSKGVIMVPDLSATAYYLDYRASEEIEATDLSLIEAAIQNNSPMLSLSASIYSEPSDKYYGTLYSDFITEYIRNTLNYDGIVLMGSDTVRNIKDEDNFYDYIIQSINSGVDMISFDIRISNSYRNSTKSEAEKLLSLYNAVISAVDNQTISLERIEEAVTRILLAKIRNNIIGDETDYSNVNFNKISDEITSYAPEFITVVGDQFTIEKEDTVLVISENYEYTGTEYSLGDNLRKFFEVRGYKNVDIYHENTLTPDTILQSAKNYDKIFISVSSVSRSKQIGFAASRINFIEFMDKLYAQNPNICIIATNMPDSLEYLPNIKNAILLYNYYESNFESLCKVLNGEAKNKRYYVQ